MELHNLRPAKGAIKKRKRIARGEGSGHGGTATKGQKGMKARSGAKSTKNFEGGQTPLQRRLPKIGFKNISTKEYVTFNLDQIQDLATKHGLSTFDHETLRKYRLVGKNDQIKILGRGELSSSIHIKANKATASAGEKVKASGGTLEIV